MGMEVPAAVAGEEETTTALSGRPSIVIVGPRNVGKRSILNRLIPKHESVKGTSPSGATIHGWTIDTKYYTADVCIWTICIDDVDCGNHLRSAWDLCEALVMVYDLSDPSSFHKLQEWLEGTDLKSYEVLMCVGNKADCIPSHFGHTEYRRRLQKRGESSSDPHPEFMEFGIDRSEGSGLLTEEDQEPEHRRRLCIEWCSERGIEYIEACAVNEIFDQCMSVDGDLQGVPRIQSALSAHMWPGLVMKPANKLTDASAASPEDDEDFSSEDEVDFLIEYELLSNASTEPWDGNEDLWSFRGSDVPPLDVVTSISEYQANESPATSSSQRNEYVDAQDGHGDTSLPSTIDSLGQSRVDDVEDQIVVVEHSDGLAGSETSASLPSSLVFVNGQVEEAQEVRNDKEHSAQDLEQLMHEMASMRENMRTMSDVQRREMAAQLAMRMATMFNRDEEEDEEE